MGLHHVLFVGVPYYRLSSCSPRVSGERGNDANMSKYALMVDVELLIQHRVSLTATSVMI